MTGKKTASKKKVSEASGAIVLAPVSEMLDDTQLVALEKDLAVMPEDIEVIKDQKAGLVKLRVALVDAAKKGRQQAVDYQKSVIAVEKGLVGRISVLEAPRAAKILEHNEAVEKAKAARKAAIEAERKEMEAKLQEIVNLSNNLYSLDDAKASLVRLSEIEKDLKSFGKYKSAAEVQIRVSLDNIDLRMNALVEEAERKAREAEAAQALAEEQARRDAAAEEERKEAARLAAEKQAELDKKQAELDAAQAKIAAAEEAEAARIAAEEKAAADKKAAAAKKKADNAKQKADDEYQKATAGDRQIFSDLENTVFGALVACEANLTSDQGKRLHASLAEKLNGDFDIVREF